jgi:hypothetical protein
LDHKLHNRGGSLIFKSPLNAFNDKAVFGKKEENFIGFFFDFPFSPAYNTVIRLLPACYCQR